jgi:FixJ family two-component response regulator
MVYVVDDEDQVRESLGFLLKSLHYKCFLYRSGEEFLDVAPVLQPGCIFLDYRMSGMGGLQVLAELRRLGVHWPVAAMTGHGDDSVGVKFLALGAIDYLEKPFDEDALIRVLQRAFDQIDTAG